MQPMEENCETEIALWLMKRSTVEQISILHNTPFRWLCLGGTVAHGGPMFE